MKRAILAVCDSEQEYAYRLADALGQQEDFGFELRTFTRTDSLREILLQEPAQILVISQKDYEVGLEALCTKLILLWEDEEHIISDHPGISKYAGVMRIRKKIMETAAETTAAWHVERAENGVRFLGFYTPVRRCLQTTLAFVSGQVLARNHKVLYLNFESCSGLEDMVGRRFESDISDLLFHLDKPGEEALRHLYQIAEPVCGMEMIAPAFSGADLLKVGRAEWIGLMELLTAGRYEYVILDLSDCVQGLVELLHRCDYVFTVVREDAAGLAKLNHYERFLKLTGNEELWTGAIRCRLPAFTRLPGDFNHFAGTELMQTAEKLLAQTVKEL